MEIENDKLNSYLVSFDKNTGKTDIIIEIGNFFWLDFNLKKRLIIGYNNSEKIEIYLNS